MPLLVVGFGPFLDVDDNPSAHLARALDGRRAGGIEVVGREMPVSYRRAPATTIAWAEELGASAILGIGVARGRHVAMVETRGRRAVDPKARDMDGELLASLGDGPEDVQATGPSALFAEALGIPLSDDAGAYVCNAWLYRVVRGTPIPAMFLHVPREGFDGERLLDGLARVFPTPALQHPTSSPSFATTRPAVG